MHLIERNVHSVQCAVFSVLFNVHRPIQLIQFIPFQFLSPFSFKSNIGKRNNAQIASKSKTHSHTNGHQRAKHEMWWSVSPFSIVTKPTCTQCHLNLWKLKETRIHKHKLKHTHHFLQHSNINIPRSINSIKRSIQFWLVFFPLSFHFPSHHFKAQIQLTQLMKFNEQ